MKKQKRILPRCEELRGTASVELRGESPAGLVFLSEIRVFFRVENLGHLKFGKDHHSRANISTILPRASKSLASISSAGECEYRSGQPSGTFTEP